MKAKTNSSNRNLEETIIKWSFLAANWNQAAPPASPSPEDLEHYFEYILPGNIVLVLGVTPSLREAAVSKGAFHISVDCTPDMIVKANEFVSTNNRSTVVQGDWRQLPISDNSVDRVIGDKVLGNLMPQDWPNVFSEVARVLRPKGRFITRATPHGKERLLINSGRSFKESILYWTKKHEEGLHINSASAGLWEDLMDASTNYETNQLGTQQLARVIPSTKDECMIIASRVLSDQSVFKAMIDRFWASRYSLWSSYCEDAIPQAAAPYFRFVELKNADDYEAGKRQPCFVLELDN
jgi:ubiquinone/menaquinone biosynthesis C-methylase UbiE